MRKDRREAGHGKAGQDRRERQDRNEEGQEIDRSWEGRTGQERETG